MQIKKLEIKQFRGLKDISLEFKDRLVVLSGRNGIGKTTIIDSILWMLTDETIVYGKENADNKNQHNLEDKVNVVLTLDDDLVLERNYYDVYDVNDEGDYVFKKNENKFLINGAKFSKTEYFNFIKNKVGLKSVFSKAKNYNVIRSVMDYNYFPTTETKTARAFIEELLGLESDLSIASKEEFAPIKNDLMALNYDASKVKNKYKNAYDSCEIRINEKTILLNDYESKYDPSLDKQYDELTEKRNEILNSSLRDSEQYLKLIEEREKLDKEIIIEEKAIIEKKTTLEKDLIKLNGEGQLINSKVENLKNTIEEIKQKINRFKALNERFDEQIKNLDESFDYKYCPHCNNRINENEKEDLIERLKAHQKDNLKDIESCNKNIENYNNDIKTLLENKKGLAEKFYKLKDELKEVEETISQNKKVIELKEKKQNIDNEISKLQEEFNQVRSNKLSEITARLDSLYSVKTLPTLIENLKKEIADLKQMKAYAELYQDLAIQFKDYKVKLIKENTNKVFPKLEFELIEEYKTGSTKDVCYVKLKDVEYKGINDGHRKFVGIMLIEDIKRALGLEDMPIIFDKFADLDDEMIKELLKETKSQIICTYVNNCEEITILETNKGE